MEGLRRDVWNGLHPAPSRNRIQDELGIVAVMPRLGEQVLLRPWRRSRTTVPVCGKFDPPPSDEEHLASRARAGENVRGRVGSPMTIIWFIIWFIANNVGADEPLLLDPVNVWTGTLLLAIALDLAGAHAGTVSSRRER